MPLNTISAPDAIDICWRRVVIGGLCALVLVAGPGGPDEVLAFVLVLVEVGGGGGKGDADGGRGLLRVRDNWRAEVVGGRRVLK
jgi:hypothetical protein